MAKKEPVNFRQWWDQVGTDNVQKVVLHTGSSFDYFKLLRYGIKKPGRDLALRIIEAARRVEPSCLPDLELLLRGVPRAGTGSAAKKIAPAPSVRRAMKRREEAVQ
jgi:hypothetical protein